MNYYGQVLEYMERTGQQDVVALILNNVGLLYLDQQDYAKAKHYFKTSLELGSQLNLTRATAPAHSNLALLYAYEPLPDSVFYHVEQATEQFYQMGDTNAVAGAWARKGILQQELGNYQDALVTFERVLELAQSQRNLPTVAASLSQMASLYLETEAYNKALEYAQRCMAVADEMGSLHHRQGAYNIQYHAYDALGQHRQALEMYVQSQRLLDSILTEENRTELIHQEYKYAYLKKAVADSMRALEAAKVKDAIIAQERAENASYRSQQIMLFGGIGILLVFLAVVYNRFLVTRRQKQIIEVQKQQIEAAAETELELQRLKQERLKADLTNAAQEITRRQEWLEQFKEKLYKAKSMGGKTAELNEAFIDIANQMQLDARNQEFYKNIDKVNQEFFHRLRESFPKITQNEQELCGLIRLKLSTKDIASVRNVEPHSIRIARSRLRKRLGLEREASLEDFLQGI